MTWRALFENPATLSPTQREALARIVSAFDAMDANERARWGKPFEGFVDAGDPRRQTIERLEALGLIEVKREHLVSTSLRRGAYGRWLGGTRRYTDVGFQFRPTEKGRQALR